MPRTIRQKLGHLFLMGFDGDHLPTGHPLRWDITRHHLGGVILFDRLLAFAGKTNNIVHAKQLKQLTDELQNVAGGDLLIAVDQEGGMVSRFKKSAGFPTSPRPADLGRIHGVRATREYGKQTAAMLRSCGINWNLAPVVDLDCYPDNPIIGRFGRSFSAHPDVVTAHARAWLNSHREAGILSCLKHFPGHGSSRTDSHLGFVDISDTWFETELLPYHKLINTEKIDSIMIGHLFHRTLDPENPATLSSRVVEDLLRKRLGYDGVVITDDMQMAAITARYDLITACCLALKSGVDMLIIGNNLSHDPQILESLLDGLVQKVENGELSEKRLDQAAKRIAAMHTHILSKK